MRSDKSNQGTKQPIELSLYYSGTWTSESHFEKICRQRLFSFVGEVKCIWLGAISQGIYINT